MKTPAIPVVGILLWVMASACNAAETPPATLPTPLSPTVSPPNEAGPPAFPQYGGPDYAGPEVAAGLYKTPAWFSLPFTFQTAQVFRGFGEQSSTGQLFGLVLGRAREPERELTFITVDPAIPAEEAIAQLRATPKVDISRSQIVEVGGISGTRFDLAGTLSGPIYIPAIGPFVGHEGGDYHTGSPDPLVRCIVLEVEGRALLIFIAAPREEYEGFLADVDQVLSTVEFAPAEADP